MPYFRGFLHISTSHEKCAEVFFFQKPHLTTYLPLILKITTHDHLLGVSLCTPQGLRPAVFCVPKTCPSCSSSDLTSFVKLSVFLIPTFRFLSIFSYHLQPVCRISPHRPPEPPRWRSGKGGFLIPGSASLSFQKLFSYQHPILLTVQKFGPQSSAPKEYTTPGRNFKFFHDTISFIIFYGRCKTAHCP